jgi:hypothetical protein
MGASSDTKSGHRGARPQAGRTSWSGRVGKFIRDFDAALRALRTIKNQRPVEGSPCETCSYGLYVY